MNQIIFHNDTLAEWQRVAFLDDDGELFLACGIFAGEMEAMLCTSYDGVPVMRYRGHIYAPASWLAKEHSRYAPEINALAAKWTRKTPSTGCEMSTGQG